MHVPCPRVWKLWQVLGAQFFRNNRILMKFGVVAPSQWSSPQTISGGFLPVHDVPASISFPPNKALSKLFPTVSCPSMRFLPLELSPSYFPRFPFRSWCRRFVSFLPTELSPSYFPRFPFRSWCRRFSLAPSQRSALPKLFPTVSWPFMVSSLLSRSLPTELSPSYFWRIPFPFMMSSFPSRFLQRSSPRAISHGFLSVHDIVASVSLPANGALPKLFPTVSFPFMISSLPSRSTRGEVN